MLHTPALQLLIATALAALIAVAARFMRMLTRSGAMAAFVVGFVVFGLGGWLAAVPLLAFFFSSSLLSKAGRRLKAKQRGVYAKGDTRDAMQVLANGGVAALLVLIAAAVRWPRDYMLLYLCALAAANADTWATEIGGLYRGRPWLVTTLRRVEAGTSGAVSPIGLLAAYVGALFVAMAAWVVWPLHHGLMLWRVDAAEVLAIAWAGFVAAFGDSILGASVQAQYRCAACGATTEREEHCGLRTQRVRGWRFLNNDGVNLANTVMGAAFGWVLLRFFAPFR